MNKTLWKVLGYAIYDSYYKPQNPILQISECAQFQPLRIKSFTVIIIKIILRKIIIITQLGNTAVDRKYLIMCEALIGSQITL